MTRLFGKRAGFHCTPTGSQEQGVLTRGQTQSSRDTESGLIFFLMPRI